MSLSSGARLGPYEIVSPMCRPARRQASGSSRRDGRIHDALHLALAIAGDAASIVTFEHRLADAARSVGLAAFP